RLLRLPEHAPLPPFLSGAVGYLGYDFVRQLERLPESKPEEIGMPQGILLFFDRVLAFDHVRQSLHLIASIDIRDTRRIASEMDRARRDLDSLEGRLCGPARGDRAMPRSRKVGVRHRTSRSDFLRSVQRAKEYIAAGDAFQIVLSQRFDLRTAAEPFS